MTNTTEAPPETVHDRVQAMIEKVTDSLCNDAWFTRVEPIEHEACSGFLPFTDGGWNGVVTLGLHGESAQATAHFAKAIEQDYEACLAAWRSHNGLPADEMPDYEGDPEWQEFATEWENGDGNDWFIYVRAIYRKRGGNSLACYCHPTEDGYEFCLGINDDYSYGRDSIAWCPGVGSHWIYESETFALSELTPEKLDEIAKAMTAAWASA